MWRLSWLVQGTWGSRASNSGFDWCWEHQFEIGSGASSSKGPVAALCHRQRQVLRARQKQWCRISWPCWYPALTRLLIETWTQKIEMLLVAWPRQKLDELATRLVLNCRGTAFQKLQLHRTEVLKNEEKAIKRIVELVGGTWGQVPLEQRFESTEV